MLYYRGKMEIKVSQRKRHIGQSPNTEVWNTELLWALTQGGEMCCMTSMCDSSHRVLPTSEAHLILSVRFFLGLHYTGMMDWLTDSTLLTSVSRPLILEDPKPWPQVVLLVFLGWPTPHLNHCSQKSHTRDYPLAARNKGQTSSEGG